MKRALLLMLAVLLGLAITGMAKTSFFDAIYIEGAFTMSGTSATAFTGTTFAVDCSSTVSIDGATSLDLLSAGHVDIEATDVRIGYSDHYTKLAVADTTGNLTITHVGGTTDLVTWTAAGGFDLVGAIALDAVTASGVVSIDDATDASSTVTGSLHTDGGLGVAKKLYVGTDLDVDGTANLDAVDIDDAVDIAGALTHVGAVYRTGNTTQTGSIALTGTLGMNDDQALTIGTTTATAATKITAEFDETTTGVGSFAMGTTAVPQVLNTNPGAAVVPMSLSVQHAGAASSLDDYIGFYNKVDFVGVGDATVTGVGFATRAYVGLTGGANNTVIDELYANQPWVRHGGAGAITAMSSVSAKVDVGAEAFTATTANGIHVHVTGASTVTGQFDGMLVEVYPDVTCLDAGFTASVNSGAVMGTGFRVLNIATSGLDLSGATLTHDVVLSDGQIIDAETLGAVVANKCTAADYQGVVQQVVLTFSLTGDHDIDVADGGKSTGVKVYDMPAGYIQVLGATIDASVVTNAVYNADTDDIFYVSVGTADGTQAADADLTNTEADIIPKTTINTDSGSGANTQLTNDWHAVDATPEAFDGASGSAVDLYVNVAVPDASNTGATTHAITGTLTLTYINLGDY